MRTLSAALVVLLASATCARADVLVAEAPYAPMVRRHYYARLAKSPARALGFELLFPGAGSAYTGLTTPALVTLGLSIAGAALWIAGAARDEPALTWSGVGVFAGARTYGLVSAPVGAALLNAAFRSQLGLSAAR